MYNETKATGGKKIIFAIIAIVVVGVIVAVVIAVSKKSEDADKLIEDQDDGTQKIIDGVYNR